MRHTVVIPTLDRPAALARCRRSLDAQTTPVTEVLLVTERGELSQLRNAGARRATRPELLSFLADDVECAPGWAAAVQARFARAPELVGVAGPAVLPPDARRRRDLFRTPALKRLYDACFLVGRASLPGMLSVAGTWTTGACDPTCTYSGPVDYLEACNQTWRADAFWAVGGFDETFGGIGDWSEPDLAQRVRYLTGGTRWFDPAAAVVHHADQTGAYLAREQVGARLSNYHRFAARWVRPHWRHTAFLAFLHVYYGGKALRWHVNRLLGPSDCARRATGS